jgi:hypothetical protein
VCACEDDFHGRPGRAAGWWNSFRRHPAANLLGGIKCFRNAHGHVVEGTGRLQLPAMIGAVDEFVAIPLERINRPGQPAGRGDNHG